MDYNFKMAMPAVIVSRDNGSDILLYLSGSDNNIGIPQWFASYRKGWKNTLKVYTKSIYDFSCTLKIR